MKCNVVFLGCTSSYGYAFSATNTKTEFMAMGLCAQGDFCTIINSLVGIPHVNKRTVLHKNDIVDVISYPLKGSQLTSWIYNIADLRNDLKRLYNSDCKNIIVLESPDYHIYRIYCHYAHKFGYKIATIAHEWAPTVKGIHFLRKPFSILYTRTFGFYTDAILPISEYIIEKIKPFRKPYLKIPVLASFDEPVFSKVKGGYFLYCVYAAYKREIIPLIDAFSEFNQKTNDKKRLILVLGGNNEQVKVITDYIDRIGNNGHIEVKRKVAYNELLNLYRSAEALLIPLNPSSMQDRARFSQKIAEYCSSGSPIISCSVGEMAYYFTDRKNAIFCDYSKNGFIDAFEWVSTHPIDAYLIGKQGYELGKREFNYLVYGKKLHRFLNVL